VFKKKGLIISKKALDRNSSGQRGRGWVASCVGLNKRIYFIYLIRSEKNTEQSNRYSVSRAARLVDKHSQLP